MTQDLFTSKNFNLLWISAALLAIGYVLLGQGPVNNPLSKTVAPVLLTAVYCVLIPWAIMVRGREKPEDKTKAGPQKPQTPPQQPQQKK